jgi:DNA-binding transcriptional LysR family regulator
MELKHLRYFVVVAEELHFSRAAARLHMAQPPLSQMIRRLEQELGVRLFHRTRRHVSLTVAGEVFLDEARATLARADSAVQRLKRAARGEMGTLKIGLVPWADLVPQFSDIIRRFNSRESEVKLDFISISTPDHPDALTAGRIDIGFFAPPAPPSDLVHEVVAVDSIVVALPTKHALCRRRVIPLEVLGDQGHVLVAPERASLISRLSRDKFPLQIRHNIDHSQTTLTLVAVGIGISLVPKSTVTLRRPGVTYRPIKPSAEVRLIAAWRDDNTSPVLARFVKVMQEVIRSRSSKRGAAET